MRIGGSLISSKIEIGKLNLLRRRFGTRTTMRRSWKMREFEIGKQKRRDWRKAGFLRWNFDSRLLLDSS